MSAQEQAALGLAVGALKATGGTLTPELFGATGDGAYVTDAVISGVGAPYTVSSASGGYSKAKPGQVVTVKGAGQAPSGTVNGQAYAASVAPLFATILTVAADGTSITVDTAPSQTVTATESTFGTDNATAIRNTFLSASATGREIFIPAKIYCMARPLDFLANTTVFASGTLVIMKDPTNAGGFLIVKQADDNIRWIGGTIDCNNLVNMNGVAAAYDPSGGVFSNNIDFRPTRVRRARINTAMHGASPFAGGGKGVTAQFDLAGFYFDGLIEDCDIGGTLEAAQSNNQLTYGCRITARVKDCPYGAWFFGGSLPSGVASTDTWGNSEAQYAQARVNLIVENCGTIAAIGTTKSPLWSNWATNLELDCFVRGGTDSVAPMTLWKGNLAHCEVKIRAAVDYLQDAVDMAAYTGASNSGLTSTANRVRLDLDLKNTIAGALFKGAALESRCFLEADYLANPTPAVLLSNVSNTVSVKYRFWNKRLGTAREGSTAGSTSNLSGDAYRLSYPIVTIDKITQMTALSAEPAGAVKGALANSDGTSSTNSFGGAGAGLYIYDNPAWRKL